MCCSPHIIIVIIIPETFTRDHMCLIQNSRLVQFVVLVSFGWDPLKLFAPDFDMYSLVVLTCCERVLPKIC